MLRNGAWACCSCVPCFIICCTQQELAESVNMISSGTENLQFVHCLMQWLTITECIWSTKDISSSDLIDFAVYFFAHLFVVVAGQWSLRNEILKWFKHSSEDNTTDILDDHHKSLMFTACLMGVYLHAPLLLANYSLGLPSSILWSLLLAIFMSLPSTRAKESILLRLMISFGKLVILVSLFPQLFLVPQVFGEYNMYVVWVHVPLHLLLSTLWMSV